MKLHVKIALANEAGEEFMGPGVCQLLEGIARTGSIRQAAREMDLSYVKALRILNRMERELNRPLLIRSKGGVTRGSTALTPDAKRLLRAFAALRRKVERTAAVAFGRFATSWSASAKPTRRRAKDAP